MSFEYAMLERIVHGIERCAAIYERRGEDVDRWEAVVRSRSLTDMYKFLDTLFGQATKPEWTPAEKLDPRIAAAVGDVRDDQTLYFMDAPEGRCYVLVMPWADNEHYTVRVRMLPPA